MSAWRLKDKGDFLPYNTLNCAGASQDFTVGYVFCCVGVVVGDACCVGVVVVLVAVVAMLLLMRLLPLLLLLLLLDVVAEVMDSVLMLVLVD